MAVALRALAILATHPDGALSTDRLGELLDTNPVVVRRVLGRLRSDGIVETRRGPGGGCALALEPARIRLGRVHRALHVALQPPASLPPALGAVLAEAESAYADALDRRTLADVLTDMV